MSCLYVRSFKNCQVIFNMSWYLKPKNLIYFLFTTAVILFQQHDTVHLFNDWHCVLGVCRMKHWGLSYYSPHCGEFRGWVGFFFLFVVDVCLFFTSVQFSSFLFQTFQTSAFTIITKYHSIICLKRSKQKYLLITVEQKSLKPGRRADGQTVV